MNPVIELAWDDETYPWKEEHLQYVVVFSVFAPMELAGKLTFAADMNAGKRGPRAACMAKATGMRAGEPDLRIYLPGGKIVFLEFKTAKGVVSEVQKARHDQLRGLGFDVRIVKAKTPLGAVRQVYCILDNL